VVGCVVHHLRTSSNATSSACSHRIRHLLLREKF
jgi:hypothetical protein